MKEFLVLGQANTLLACCYLCLAVAAWAFHRRVAWLSRAALALPFLLTLLQSLTPDGAETRALRIWEEPSGGQRWAQRRGGFAGSGARCEGAEWLAAQAARLCWEGLSCIAGSRTSRNYTPWIRRSIWAGNVPPVVFLLANQANASLHSATGDDVGNHPGSSSCQLRFQLLTAGLGTPSPGVARGQGRRNHCRAWAEVIENSSVSQKTSVPVP